jgi:phosphoribosylglycinamide formyltransferase-1
MLRIVEESQGGILRLLCKVSAVVSNVAEVEGLRSARSKDITAVTVPSLGKSREDFEKDLFDKLQLWKPDYIILAGFMRILSADFIRKFPRRIINIHPADTNRHRGLNGYGWAFKNKLSKTKITVHYVDENLDAGEIIEQRDVDLSGVKSEEEVRKRGLAVEHEFYSQVLKKVLT